MLLRLEDSRIDMMADHPPPGPSGNPGNDGDQPSEPSAPSLPNRPLHFNDAVALKESNAEIVDVWPLWGWLTPDDIFANALAVFTPGNGVYLLAYDKDAQRWADVARFNEIVVGEADPLFAGFEALEMWMRDHYDKDELMRFRLNLEIE